MKMEQLIGVQGDTEGILGKIFYYSYPNAMIDRQEFENIGISMGLSKFKPARTSLSGAYRNATTAVKDRLNMKYGGGRQIYNIFCRNNKSDKSGIISRELVKETLGYDTNQFKKLANICFDRQSEKIFAQDIQDDYDVNVQSYIDRAFILFEKFKHCYGAAHIDSVVQDLLSRMEASKISIRGNLYFVPKDRLNTLILLENYLDTLQQFNQSDESITLNSMYVVDDEKQREKMKKEFYASYRAEIDFYSEKVQHFINNGCKSPKVIDRWAQKIKDLEAKKTTYENVLKQELTALDQDFGLLEMQAQELQFRNLKGQTTLQNAA